jgi:predicted NAD/FAD-dependent oxidoreductase
MSDFMTSRRSRIAVIGGGMCGLACAHRLCAEGLAPTIFEKSRGLGGRLATRRLEDGITFDHGAQYLTARGVAFQEMLHQSMNAETAGHWAPNQYGRKSHAAENWIVGTPGMNAIVKPLAKGIDVQFATEVSAIDRDADGWRVQTPPDPGGVLFDFIVLTAPAPQARALMAFNPEIVEDLDRVSIAPCWALLVSFETPSNLPFDVLRPEDGSLAWIARNSSKPGREARKECWIAHASPSWSAAHLELDRDTVTKKLVGLFSESFGGGLPEIHYAAAHRWRYALTTEPLGRPFVSSDDQTAYIGGDWCLGARVENAYESGRAIAAALIANIK